MPLRMGKADPTSAVVVSGPSVIRHTDKAARSLRPTSHPRTASQPKWVVSRSLKSVGPNATLVANDIEAAIRGQKARLVGEIQVAGPDLARSLTDLGLIDEYQLYLRPPAREEIRAQTPVFTG